MRPKKDENLSLNASVSSHPAPALLYDFNEKVYALVEPEIFKSPNIDFDKTRQDIT